MLRVANLSRIAWSLGVTGCVALLTSVAVSDSGPEVGSCLTLLLRIKNEKRLVGMLVFDDVSRMIFSLTEFVLLFRLFQFCLYFGSSSTILII